jgi:predicted nucleotidyltransferase
MLIMENRKKLPRSYNSADILTVLEQHRSIFSGYGVRKIGLFGSHRHDVANDRSDMDFVVVMDNPTFDSYMDTKFFLEDIFHCEVDLVLEETIKPRLRKQILSEVVYAAGY